MRIKSRAIIRLMSKLWKWLPVVVWMGVIFSFSNHTTISTGQVHIVDFLIKKTAHIAEYATLYLLIFNALEKNRLQKAFILALIYAFTDETHQLFTPGRTGMLRDVLTFDTIGLLIGALAANNLSRWKRN